METLQRREVGCSGGRSGRGPATWGQEAIWSVVRDLGADAARYNVSTSSPVPPGVSLDLVLESLSKLMLLHDSLRTRLLPTGSGALEQVVDAAGSIPIVCCQYGSGAGVATSAGGAEGGDGDEAGIDRMGRALLDELAKEPFDTAREWPVRVGVVEAGGEVRHMAFVLAHTAVDAWGLQRMILNLTSLALGESPEWISEQRPGLQPLEEAAFQGSPRGRRQDAAARRHWRETLRRGPARLFPAEPGALDGPLFPNAVLRSPALGTAVRRVAAGRQASSSSVLLAATAAMLCRISGSPDAVLQIVVNNRFLPRLTNSVSTVAQEGLFHLADVGTKDGDSSFPDLVRRAHAASLAAYRHAYYDKALLDQEIAQMQAENGATTDRSCILNDYRGLIPQMADAQPDPGSDRPSAPVDLVRERDRTTLSWPVEFEPRRNVTFALDALDVLDGSGSLDLAMTADGAVLPRSDMERFLVGIEDLIVGDALELGE